MGQVQGCTSTRREQRRSIGFWMVLALHSTSYNTTFLQYLSDERGCGSHADEGMSEDVAVTLMKEAMGVCIKSSLRVHRSKELFLKKYKQLITK